MSLPCTPSDELEKISVSGRPQNLEAIFKSYELKIYTKREHFKRRKGFFQLLKSTLWQKFLSFKSKFSKIKITAKNHCFRYLFF